MLILLSLILTIYSIFIITCTIAWVRYRVFDDNQNNNQKVSLSLVVCFKNEERRLKPLLQSIEKQIEGIDHIIFANDNSTDNTLEILTDFASKHNNITLFSILGNGKKNALRESIAKVKTQYILTTDADCIIPNGYFRLVRNFLTEKSVDLMIGSVKYLKESSILSQMEALEFSSLIATTAGTTIARIPIMCNGANMAFTKDLWDRAKGSLVEKEISGDDVFLLHFAKKTKSKIMVLKHQNAFLETKSSNSIKEFFNQRKRWASKSRSYTDTQTILVALLIFTVNITSLISLIYGIFEPIFLSLYIGKIIIDSVLLVPFLKFSKQNYLIKLIPIVDFLYPFYILFTSVGGLFYKTKWR